MPAAAFGEEASLGCWRASPAHPAGPTASPAARPRSRRTRRKKMSANLSLPYRDDGAFSSFWKNNRPNFPSDYTLVKQITSMINATTVKAA